MAFSRQRNPSLANPELLNPGWGDMSAEQEGLPKPTPIVKHSTPIISVTVDK